MYSGPRFRVVHEINPARVPANEREHLLQNPVFGKVFTDHIATIRYTPERGWYEAKIGPHDAALFRPDANARRFRHSARRLAMVELPEVMFLEAVCCRCILVTPLYTAVVDSTL